MTDLAKLLADLNGKKMDPVKREKLRLELLRAQGPRKDMTTLARRDIQHDLNADMLDGYHFYDFMQDPTTKVGQIIYRYGTGSTNYAAYAQGSRATACSGANANYAIDGNVATCWHAATGGLGPSDHGQWINVDFGAQTLIGWTRITQHSDINYRVAVYKIQYSIEETVTPTTFIDLDTITSTDEVQTYYIPGGGITFRHLRYLCVADYHQWFNWGVAEIEAYRPSEFNDLRALDIGSTGTVLSVVDGLPSWEATATPSDHKTSHENGGSDEISVAGLSGELADAQTPKAHKTTHENGGADEISVAGLSGELADAQTPKAHNQAATTVTVADAGNFYTGTEAETVLQEVGTDNAASIHDNVAGEIAAITAKTLPVLDDLLLIEDSAATNAKKKMTLSTLASIKDDRPLKDATNGLHFTEYASGVPTGWTAVTAATSSSQADEYSFWRLDGSGNSTYKYKRQTGITLEGLAANQWRTWQWTGVYVREGLWVQNLLYSFGVYADNAGSPNEDVYVKTFLQWYAPGQVWRAWGEQKDGSTVTTGSAYLLPTPLVQPLTIRQMVRNTTYTARAYISTAPFDVAHLLLQTGTATATWGNVWMQIEQTRNSQGVNNSLYINAVDTYEAAG